MSTSSFPLPLKPPSIENLSLLGFYRNRQRMAFFSKAGNVLRQVVNKPQISHEISASTPSVFQILRFMSSSKVFVGGISWSTSDAGLQDAFRKYGDVIEARVITDRETGRSRGFGFVTFGSAEDASAAIQALDGQMLDGRSIRVNYANERPPRSYGGGGGFGGGGYGGGRYGGGGGFGGGSYGSGGEGGGYGGSGNFGGQGGEGSYGANNYGSGGSMGYGGDNQNYGVAGGAAGSDNFPGAGNTFTSSGFEGNTGFGYGSNNQYGDNESGNVTEAGGDDSHPEQGSYRDDDDQPDDYAKRA